MFDPADHAPDGAEQINDGGPAFPHGPGGGSITFENGMTTHQVPAGFGMSLRDWFAGLALGNAYAVSKMAGEKDDAIAGSAYAMADAMLKERGA